MRRAKITKAEIVPLYTRMIGLVNQYGQGSLDEKVSALNGMIVALWSPAALNDIKDMAWKEYQKRKAQKEQPR